VWQFEGYGYVPCGTSGVCIMQAGAEEHRRLRWAVAQVEK